MSIRFSIAAQFSESTTEEVLIDAHHIASDGDWFGHPIRTHKLRVPGTEQLLAHVALGFVLHKGKREELLLCVTHLELAAQHGLELVVSQAGADTEALELSRQVLAPGDSMPLSLYAGTHVRIREVLMSEVQRGS